MGTVIPPDDTFEVGNLAPFVTPEQKHELAGKKIPFAVVNAKPKKLSQFKAQNGQPQFETLFYLTGRFFDGEVHVLSMGHNEIRERQAQAVLDRLVGSPGAQIGPLYLQQIHTKGGQRAWVISSEAGDGTVVDDNADAAPATGGQGTADDDIPF